MPRCPKLVKSVLEHKITIGCKKYIYIKSIKKIKPYKIMSGINTGKIAANNKEVMISLMGVEE